MTRDDQIENHLESIFDPTQEEYREMIREASKIRQRYNKKLFFYYKTLSQQSWAYFKIKCHRISAFRKRKIILRSMRRKKKQASTEGSNSSDNIHHEHACHPGYAHFDPILFIYCGLAIFSIFVFFLLPLCLQNYLFV